MKKEKSQAQIMLESIELQDHIVRNKLIERSQWREIALGFSANIDGVRVSSCGNKSKIEEAITKCVDMEAEIDRQIDKLIDLKREALKLIESVANATQYRILHMRYIQYMKLCSIAEAWGVPETNITTEHGRALASVQKILDSRK